MSGVSRIARKYIRWWFVFILSIPIYCAGEAALAVEAEINLSQVPEDEAVHQLYLEVHINGRATGLVAFFQQSVDGGFATTADELKEIGFHVSEAAVSETQNALIELDSLPGVAFEYDQARQKIDFFVSDFALSPQIVTLLSPHDSGPTPQEPGWGAFANYSLFGAIGGERSFGEMNFVGLSGTFDSHLYSPHGGVANSMLFRVDREYAREIRRLESNWTAYDIDRMLTFRVGDTITGGLPWTRPLRLGGLQLQRNFTLRPDLITRPLPSFKGSAAVPTTVEVFANNVRTYRGELEPGPFIIPDIPVGTGANTTRIVVQDASGQDISIEAPFYASTRLLRAAMADFSFEAGYPRRSFGLESFDYDDSLFGLATLRYGMSDDATAEAHVEVSEAHLGGGVGGAFATGRWGTTSLFFAGSHADDETGGQAGVMLEFGVPGFSAFGRSQRSLGSYNDGAAVSAKRASATSDFKDFQPPKASDQVGFSFPLSFDPTKISINHSRREAANGDKLSITSLSLGRALLGKGYFTFNASAFRGDGTSYGAFASFSLPFGNGRRATSGITKRRNGYGAFTEISRANRRSPNEIGWRLGTRQGASEAYYASANYHGPAARLESGIELNEYASRMTTKVDGALVLAGGSLLPAHHIYDSFAIADVGLPDVGVFHENRFVGRTNSLGRVIVPNLRALENSRISIDPSNLPLSVRMATTRQVVVAPPNSGVEVDFDLEIETSAALVSFTGETGLPIEVGSFGRLSGRDEGFVVGYDGEAYLSDLQAWNRVVITKPNGDVCVAEFGFDVIGEPVVRIDNILCRLS